MLKSILIEMYFSSSMTSNQSMVTFGYFLEHFCKLICFELSQFLSHSFPAVRNHSKMYLKAQFSFSSGVPLEVTSIARRNSLKSTKPFLSLSKVLKTWSQNCPALPAGKHLEQIFMKASGVSLPSGQSCLNPLYHSLMVPSSYLVFDLKNSRSSLLSRSPLDDLFPILTR